jgi:hypothetical protein
MRVSFGSASIDAGRLVGTIIGIANSGEPCPSCGWPRGKGRATCEMCGCTLADADGKPPGKSRLTDKGLGETYKKYQGSVRTYTALRWICVALMIVLIAAIIMTFVSMSDLITLVPVMFILIPVAGVASSVFKLLREMAGMKMSALVGVNIASGIAEKIFGECTYYHNLHINESIVDSSNLVPGWNNIYGSDYVSAQYKGHTVEYSDVTLELITQHEDYDSDRATTTTSTSSNIEFRGQWLVCDLGRALDEPVYLIEKGERKGLAKKLLGERMSAVSDTQTGNPAFDGRFQIITGDTDAASRILVSPLLESILLTDDAAGARTYIAFTDGYIHIALGSGRGTFDRSGGVLGKATLGAMRERMEGESKRITDVLGILDAAMQNTYLFPEKQPEV